MNDSLLYFLFYTIMCLGIGFVVGRLYELRRSLKYVSDMREKFNAYTNELKELYEKRITSIGKCSGDGHNSSEHVPTYTA